MQETFRNQKHDFLHRGYLKHHSNSACSSMHSDWKGLSNLRERSSNCPCDTKITVMGDKMLITLGTLKNHIHLGFPFVSDISSSLASKCQDFKLRGLQFHFIKPLKNRHSNFKDLQF